MSIHVLAEKRRLEDRLWDRLAVCYTVWVAAIVTLMIFEVRPSLFVVLATLLILLPWARAAYELRMYTRRLNRDARL